MGFNEFRRIRNENVDRLRIIRDSTLTVHTPSQSRTFFIQNGCILFHSVELM